MVLGHLDHEGIGAEVNGDRLYNGALDNAAGIAAVLETARAAATSPTRPRRSILFLAVTAEEKGLLGSEYFARNPTVPSGSLVGAVNIDMPILLYDFTDVIAFGATHSSLGQVVADAAKQIGLTPDARSRARRGGLHAVGSLPLRAAGRAGDLPVHRLEHARRRRRGRQGVRRASWRSTTTSRPTT